jgi:hypothetical protein
MSAVLIAVSATNAHVHVEDAWLGGAIERHRLVSVRVRT